MTCSGDDRRIFIFVILLTANQSLKFLWSTKEVTDSILCDMLAVCD